MREEFEFAVGHLDSVLGDDGAVDSCVLVHFLCRLELMAHLLFIILEQLDEHFPHLLTL